MDYELQHHGIIGQKWGVRRFQNKDGALTEAGKKRYKSDNNLKSKKNKKSWIDIDSNSYKSLAVFPGIPVAVAVAGTIAVGLAPGQPSAVRYVNDGRNAFSRAAKTSTMESVLRRAMR